MKNLIAAIAMFFFSCGLTKDLNEYEALPAMLVKVEKVERWINTKDETRTMQKKQTWEFLDNNYQIVIYVNVQNTEEIGIVALKDRRR